MKEAVGEEAVVERRQGRGPQEIETEGDTTQRSLLPPQYYARTASVPTASVPAASSPTALLTYRLFTYRPFRLASPASLNSDVLFQVG